MSRHFEESADVDATADEVFGFVDDHERVSAHMMAAVLMDGACGHSEATGMWTF